MEVEHNKVVAMPSGEVVRVGTYVKIEEGDDPSRALDALTAGLIEKWKRKERVICLDEYSQEEPSEEMQKLLDETNQHLAEHNSTFQLPENDEFMPEDEEEKS